MIKFDLQFGYFHVDLSEISKQYVCFSHDDKFYAYNVLPFRLGLSDGIFSKCYGRS